METRHRPKVSIKPIRRDTTSAEKDTRKSLPGHALPSVSGQQRVDCGGGGRWAELLQQEFTQRFEHSGAMFNTSPLPSLVLLLLLTDLHLNTGKSA